MIISKHLGSTLKTAEKLNYEGLTDTSDNQIHANL